MWNILYLFQALAYTGLLYVVFKSKKRIESEENRIFNILTIVQLVMIITELILQISIRLLDNQRIMTFIFARLYLVAIHVWFCIFSIYSYYITRAKKIDDAKKRKKLYVFVKIIVYTIMVVGTVLYLILPIEVMYDGSITYSYGMSVNLLKASLGIGLLFWLILLFVNKKHIRQKEFVPIYSVVILMILNVILQTINPSILIASSTLAFTVFLMFFTIENPDLRMIQELELAKEHAEKANRSKTEFLSSMSHEVRTPLNAIVGFSDCIMQSSTLSEAKENAKDIVNASQTLLEIVNGILDISKIEAGKIEIVNSKYNPTEVFTELAKLISPRMKEKGLDFSYYIDPDIPTTLNGDHANIRKIVTNLLSNACKYTERGFVRYEVNCVNLNGYSRLIISVEDSGRGIKKDQIDKLFTKFQRLEEDRNTTIEGTGLGLAITKQLTELMGGKIIVHTIYGEGSKFTAIINQKIDVADDAVVRKVKDTLDLTDVKILLVDDAPLNLKVATKLLQQYNANQIDTCSSGFECIERIQSGRQYDLVLLDDMMPKMSGVQTLKKLKEEFHFKTPVVALTANAISGMRDKYLSDGFDDYLAKPIDKGELVRVVNQILGRVVTEELRTIPIDTPSIKPTTSDQTIIPVDDNIEQILGKKLDLSEREIVNGVPAQIEVLEDEPLTNYVFKKEKEVNTSPELIPVVDIDPPKIEAYDQKYLEENGIDVNHGIELLGDLDMYNSTMLDFLSEVEEKWNRILDSLEKQDMENYAIDVHSLKSDSKYLGFTKLADIAYQHELKSKENDSKYIRDHYKELEDEYDRILGVVKNYCQCIK